MMQPLVSLGLMAFGSIVTLMYCDLRRMDYGEELKRIHKRQLEETLKDEKTCHEYDLRYERRRTKAMHRRAQGAEHLLAVEGRRANRAYWRAERMTDIVCDAWNALPEAARTFATGADGQRDLVKGMNFRDH